MNILFTIDIFSHPVNHMPTNHDWLVDFWFKSPAHTTTKIVDIINDDEKISTYLPKEPYSILDNTSEKIISQFLEKHVNNYDIVIAFECKEKTRTILESLHKKIIFTFFSPIRFTNRLTFSLHSNNPEIQKKIISANEKSKKYYLEQAVYISSLISNNFLPLQIPKNSILLIGQVEEDLSVWNGSKYLSLDDFIIQINEIISNYDYVYYKPHPFSNGNNKKIQSLQNVELINEEIYQLLSSDSIEHIITVSSSVAEEAKLFNKKITKFSNSYIPNNSKNIPYTMDSNFWNLLFTRNNNFVDDNLFIDEIDIRPIRNTYWGYKFIKKIENPYVKDLIHQNSLLKEELHMIKCKYDDLISDKLMHLEKALIILNDEQISLKNNCNTLNDKYKSLEIILLNFKKKYFKIKKPRFLR